MYSINNKKIIPIKATTVIDGNISKQIEKSSFLYYIIDGKCTDSVCAKQFVCKTKNEINYNIFVINTRNYSVNVKLIDILPDNLKEIYVKIQDKPPIKVPEYSDEIDITIPLIASHSYSRIVVNIENTGNIDI